MSSENQDSTPPPKPDAPMSIVDLIIQEQLEKNTLVLAPRRPEPEPAPEPVAEEATVEEVPVEEAPPTPEPVAEEPAVEEAPPAPEPVAEEATVVEAPVEAAPPAPEPMPEQAAAHAAPEEALPTPEPVAEQPAIEEAPTTPDPVAEEAVAPEPAVEESQPAALEARPTPEPVAEDPTPEQIVVDSEPLPARDPNTQELLATAPQEPDFEPLGAIPLDNTATIALPEISLGEAETMFLGPSASLDDEEDIFALLIEANNQEEPEHLQLPEPPPVFTPEPAPTIHLSPFAPPKAVEPASPPAQPAPPAATAEQVTLEFHTPPALELPPQVQRVEKFSPEPTVPLAQYSRDGSETIDLRLPKVPDKAGRTVGGKLRDLEESFQRAEKQALPDGLKERAFAAITLLSKLPGVQRALVLVEEKPGEFRAVAKAGVQSNDYLTQTPLHLMRSVIRTQEPLLMLDTTRDPRLMNDKQLHAMNVKSGLCVPFRDCVSGSRGVLYADNLESANAFTHTELRNIRDFCKRLASDRDLGEFRVAAPEAAKPSYDSSSPPQLEPPGWDPRLILAVACVALIVIWPSLSNPPKKEVKPPTRTVQVTRQTTDPKIVILSFLRAVETSNFQSAYNYLSEENRKSLQLDSFSKVCKQFTQDSKNRWLLAGLSVVDGPLRPSGTKSYATIGTDGQPLDWEFTLKKSADSWYISDIKGMTGFTL